MITDEIIENAAAMIRAHLVAYQAEVADAFANFDGDATVTMRVRFRRFGDEVQVETAVRAKTNGFSEKDARMVKPQQTTLEFKRA